MNLRSYRCLKCPSFEGSCSLILTPKRSPLEYDCVYYPNKETPDWELDSCLTCRHYQPQPGLEAPDCTQHNKPIDQPEQTFCWKHTYDENS